MEDKKKMDLEQKRDRMPAADGEYRSRVYTDRPDYADFGPPAKFQAVTSIIAKRLREHPNAVCSYSGGADSDILLDLIEKTRNAFRLPPVRYAFFNTGLEMKATKDHVKSVAEKYGVEITEYRPRTNIVTASRKYGIPFVSKIMSAGLEGWQKKEIPLSIADEYAQAGDKAAKRRELSKRFPKCESIINFLCCCNSEGEPRPNIQLVINSSKYMRDFIAGNPPDFQISAQCCDYCKNKDKCEALKKLAEKIDDTSRYAENTYKIRQSLQKHGGHAKIYVYTNGKTGEIELSPEMTKRILGEMECVYRESIQNAKEEMDSIVDGVIKSIGGQLNAAVCAQ